jgi:acyl-coenzyme A thioesterase PaaI-like protein
VSFGVAFAVPGTVHGGLRVALLDEALGMASIFSGSAG